MSYSRPSKAERERWAELLGDEGRKARRIRIRVTAITVLVAAVAGGFWFVNSLGLAGSCPASEDLRATWAKSADEVDAAARTQAINDTIDCVDMVGRTREQIQDELGDWTSVDEYKPARRGGRASFLVWSNGSRTSGVRVDFRDNGIARSAQAYEPPKSGSEGASGA